MNLNLKNLGKVLDKKAQKSINGSGGRTCDGRRYCYSGQHTASGNPICVPCGEEEPPKK
ncbi:hypothetical protein [Tenacibaculum agarivorans]|uniref:hypothetical protein n=1 Tax=Tenacibaculum agarivorans TaxID=1908389 RepID=UPI000AB850EA|nr:hypothetical protein [Tenacibaculum agarivorans]